MAYTVVRTDMMAGTINPAFLENGRYVKNSAYADIENGSIVSVGALENGERESHVYSDVAAGTDLSKLVLIAAPEVIIDTYPHKGIADFINKAGTCIRGYYLLPNDEFSVTAEGFDGAVPQVGASVGIAANTHKLKVDATDTVIGTVTHIEVKKYMTFYTVKVRK